jgi:hypothetical protein
MEKMSHSLDVSMVYSEENSTDTKEFLSIDAFSFS